MNTVERINYNEEMKTLMELAEKLEKQMDRVNKLRSVAEEQLRYEDLYTQDIVHTMEAVKLDATEQSKATKEILVSRERRRETKKGIEKFKNAKLFLDQLYEPLNKIVQMKNDNEEKIVVYVPRTVEGVAFLEDIKNFETRTKQNVKINIKKSSCLEKPEIEFEKAKTKEEINLGESQVAATTVIIQKPKRKRNGNRKRNTNTSKIVKLELQGTNYIIKENDEVKVFPKYGQMLEYAKKNRINFSELDGKAAHRMAQIFREKKNFMEHNERNNFKQMFKINES